MPVKTRKLATLPSYFDYIFVPLGQKVHLRLDLNPKVLSVLDPNSTRKAQLDLQLVPP